MNSVIVKEEKVAMAQVENRIYTFALRLCNYIYNFVVSKFLCKTKSKQIKKHIRSHRAVLVFENKLFDHESDEVTLLLKKEKAFHYDVSLMYGKDGFDYMFVDDSERSLVTFEYMWNLITGNEQMLVLIGMPRYPNMYFHRKLFRKTGINYYDAWEEQACEVQSQINRKTIKKLNNDTEQ